MCLESFTSVVASLAYAVPFTTNSRCAGHYDCLHFLIKHHAPANDTTIRMLILTCQLECLKMLIARGLPATPLIFPSSSTYVHLPTDHGTFMKVIRSGAVHPAHR